ncbi:MAG: prephenate dehydrogenase [Cellulomonadaceae bacterium]
MSAQAAPGGAAPRGHVAVVSLGLIGGSIALRLVERGYQVTAWNPSPGALEAAAEHGVEPADSVAALCADEPDVLVLANPLRAMRTVLTEVAAHQRPGTVVTDVGSVKGPVAELVRETGVSRFVGAHPMAGTESSGFAAANPAILDGARWAIAVDDATRARDLLRVAALITGSLDGVAHPVAPEVHDEAVALISHVPHVLATELLDLVGRAPVRCLALNLAAGSFRDGTRVAGTNPRRTEAMVVENAGWVAPVLRVVARDLTMLADALESNGPVASFFDEAQRVRADSPTAGLRRDAVGADGPGGLTDLELGAGWRHRLLDAGERGDVITAAEPGARVLRLRRGLEPA